LSENRLLKRTFALKLEDITGSSRKPHNEEFNNLHSSPNIVKIIKSRSVGCGGHVFRMGGIRN
jgi:hypothetical protein